jgi:hypothetical protein
VMAHEPCELVKHAADTAETAAIGAGGAARDALAAKEITKSFDWKLNVILGGVAATFATVAGVAIWTLTQLQSVEADVRRKCEDDAKHATRDQFAEERRELKEDLKSERVETVRTLLDEQAKRGKDPDVVTVARGK